jgi:hypothetical protein
MGIVGCGSSPPKDLQQSDNEEEKVGNKTSPSRWMRSKLPLLVSAHIFMAGLLLNGSVCCAATGSRNRSRSELVLSYYR